MICARTYTVSNVLSAADWLCQGSQALIIPDTPLQYQLIYVMKSPLLAEVKADRTHILTKEARNAVSGK